ncbi:MAG: response regulator transcription factor [Candidatus Riflebacteria bacterium]|nr:response regulator transcription factor [Candidatus Riflebacteria bacterium]
MSLDVVLVDDHSLFREALRMLVESSLPGAKVVGEASTGLEALELCRRLKPEIMVLDIAMPDLGGFEVLASLPATSPATRVIVVSQHADRAYVIRAFRLGAKAYLPKMALAKDLVKAIQAVRGGRTYVDPSVAGVLVEALVHPAPRQELDPLEGLTEREREILKLTAEGRLAKEIAQMLRLSLHTVNRHRANLMKKLDLHGKADLVRLAVRLKSVDP